MALSAPDTTQVHKLLADCEIGDRVMNQDVAEWSQKRVHQEFFPVGHPPGSPPWLFAPLYEGEEFVGWKRID